MKSLNKKWERVLKIVREELERQYGRIEIYIETNKRESPKSIGVVFNVDKRESDIEKENK